jgi:hypothetical protein
MFIFNCAAPNVIIFNCAAPNVIIVCCTKRGLWEFILVRLIVVFDRSLAPQKCVDLSSSPEFGCIPGPQVPRVPGHTQGPRGTPV